MKCLIHYWEDAAFRCRTCGFLFCTACQVICGGRSFCLNCGEEEGKMMALRGIVDTLALNIQAGGLSLNQIDQLIEQVKEQVLDLFPGKAELFEMIYRPRFLRLGNEFGNLNRRRTP